jgi:copper chaperone CopZ
MKTLKLLFVIALSIFLTDISVAQKESKYKELTIKVSVQCGMCKDRVEKALAFEKGVKSSTVDLENKTVTVKYKSSKTTPDKIRKAIAKLGHDADNVKADEKAYNDLPQCCKKPDDPEYIKH